jgi:hypothetical protein
MMEANANTLTDRNMRHAILGLADGLVVLLSAASMAGLIVGFPLGFSLYAAGTGASRLCGSLLLGSGVLAESWCLGGVAFSRYHSVFLASGIGTLMALLLLAQIPGPVRQVGRLPSVWVVRGGRKP